MWKIHGLKKLPTIIFRETKQIIPDKNLFGASNFATNAFDVLIQLANRNGSRSARLPSRSQPQPQKQTIMANNQLQCAPKSDSENNGGASVNSNVMMNQFTNGAMDKVNINHLITDVGSTSNGGDDINMFADIGSDSDSDHDYPRETNQRGTYGESDFGHGHDFNSGTSGLSLNDVFEDEEEDENQNKIVDHKISLNSPNSRRKTNVLKEGQNEGNDSVDSDVSL